MSFYPLLNMRIVLKTKFLASRDIILFFNRFLSILLMICKRFRNLLSTL